MHQKLSRRLLLALFKPANPIDGFDGRIYPKRAEDILQMRHVAHLHVHQHLEEQRVAGSDFEVRDIAATGPDYPGNGRERTWGIAHADVQPGDAGSDFGSMGAP